MSVETSSPSDTSSVPAVSAASARSAAPTPERHASWGGVVALMVGVFALVTGEFLPASLL
ncbi:hypothetical protein AB4Z18_15145 [Leifsonia sp. 2TAF2]|uniref:hypothetical protein n=1 Tax=Leifsonia sp. 2TAF2 TaxID=3233009 RepID=UPI003F96A1BA